MYGGVAGLVAVLAFLWGSQSKILAAGILLAAIIQSNLVLALRRQNAIDGTELALCYAVFDGIACVVFVWLASKSIRIERNRWAAFLAAIQFSMTVANIAAVSDASLLRSASYSKILNSLTLAGLVACLVGFTPKSWEEAIGVLRMKWIYFKADLFRFQAYSKRMPKNDDAVSPIDAAIGARIREARILAELSREDFAQHLQVTVAQVQRYESGANRVSAARLFQVARVLNVPVARFYDGLDEVMAPFSADIMAFRAKSSRD